MPLLIGIGLLLSGCVESVDYGPPVYGYDYPAYGSLYVDGWGGWHHGWNHGHWDADREVAHAGGGWGHGFAGHSGFGAGHGGGFGHGGGGHGGGGHR
jgi:hypothetical protein